MKTLKWIPIIGLASAALFFLTGTTYVVEQGGDQIASWVENDGKAEVHTIGAAELNKVAPYSRVQKSAELRDSIVRAPGKKQNTSPEFKLAGTRNANWGISRGMTRDQVDSAARRHGVALYKKYTESIPTDDGGTHMNLVYEYRWRDAGLEYQKKVYFADGANGTLSQSAVWKISDTSWPAEDTL